MCSYSINAQISLWSFHFGLVDDIHVMIFCVDIFFIFNSIYLWLLWQSLSPLSWWSWEIMVNIIISYYKQKQQQQLKVLLLMHIYVFENSGAYLTDILHSFIHSFTVTFRTSQSFCWFFSLLYTSYHSLCLWWLCYWFTSLKGKRTWWCLNNCGKMEKSLNFS